MWTDTQRDVMKLIVTFRNFVRVPKNVPLRVIVTNCPKHDRASIHNILHIKYVSVNVLYLL
jgi:hypothetical protein